MRLSVRARLVCYALRWRVDPMLALEGDAIEFARAIEAARQRRFS